MRRIAFVTHALDPFEGGRYIGRLLAEIWRKQGHEVVVTRGADHRVDADLAIAHVDLTRTPPEYAALLSRYPRVVNGSVLDISKRRTSQQLVRVGDGYAGPVIVKTNRNFGGHGEWRHLQQQGGVRARLAAFRENLPWWLRGRMSPSHYRIFERRADVPAPVWWNRDLVVERFLPERCEDGYRLRVWVFFGDRENHTAVISREAIAKGATIVRIEQLGEVPPELRERRRALGFDYGKFDYGMVDGRPVLYDANRTPGLPYEAERYRPRAENLAPGLESFFRA